MRSFNNHFITVLSIAFLCGLIGCSTQKQTIVSVDIDNWINIDNPKEIATDGLGNIYTLSGWNRIEKYDDQGELLHFYSNDRLGKISVFDCSNPLKIMIYFENFQIVVSLDNTLSESARYNLNDIGFDAVSCVGSSNDNDIWIYDKNNFVLRKINRKGEVSIESSNLLTEGLEDLDPQKIIEEENHLYVLDPSIGIVIFDNIGQYIKTNRVSSIKSIKPISDTQYLMLRNNKISLVNWSQSSATEVYKSTIDLKDFALDESLYLLNKNGVERKSKY